MITNIMRHVVNTAQINNNEIFSRLNGLRLIGTLDKNSNWLITIVEKMYICKTTFIC